ncbi:LacI family DNA-binding transcriptional regulator [Streptomyces sp. M19]
MPSASGRVTQADVARIAGVSQAMVSLVLNGSDTVRIAPETRRRVEEVLRSTGYTVDIMGRGCAASPTRYWACSVTSRSSPRRRRLLPAVPARHRGGGRDARLRSAAVHQPARRDGRRLVYEQGTNRLRIADGCVLLGRHNDPRELSRLVEEAFPFVFIGRRESPAGRSVTSTPTTPPPPARSTTGCGGWGTATSRC